MASKQESKYTCIREAQISQHENDITQLKVRADFKEEDIKEIKADMEKMNNKLDNIDQKIEDFMRKSIKDDSNINNRVTALENTVKVLKWVVATCLSFIGVVVAVLTFAMMHLH